MPRTVQQIHPLACILRCLACIRFLHYFYGVLVIHVLDMYSAI